MIYGQQIEFSGVLGCDGAFHLHLAKTKFPIRYLAGYQAMAIFTQIRKEILQNKQTTRGNTDTRLGRNFFFKGDLGRQIALIELGWVGGRGLVCS